MKQKTHSLPQRRVFSSSSSRPRSCPGSSEISKVRGVARLRLDDHLQVSIRNLEVVVEQIADLAAVDRDEVLSGPNTELARRATPMSNIADDHDDSNAESAEGPDAGPSAGKMERATGFEPATFSLGS